MAQNIAIKGPESEEKVLLVCVIAPYNKTTQPLSYFEEFKSLARTNGISDEHTFFLKLRAIDSAYFIGKGKLEDIRKICEEQGIQKIIISETLTAQQERNLEDLFDLSILDRTGLILEIFEKAAVSAEGKTQVAMAAFSHRKSRLAGKGIYLAQQEGSVGLRSGPGETAKERETRYIDNAILKMKRDLDKIHKVRETQRKQRLVNKVAQFCLIGYTNAGKSTILNTLTKSSVLAEDKLFATLDTTTRELFINAKKKGVLSDTVGFIQNLPHKLIEAFKSTLSELQYADLLIHVIDASNPDFKTHIDVTLETLRELHVDKPMVYVFNKIDLVENKDEFESIINQYTPHVLINAKTKEGIAPLIAFLDAF